MLVVLLTAALLALSSAQNAEEDPVQQTQDPGSDIPSADADAGNGQEAESVPAANEEPSANSGNEEEQQQQESLQAENPSDSAGNDLENQPEEGNVEDSKKEPLSSPENSQGLPQQNNPKQEPSLAETQGRPQYYGSSRKKTLLSRKIEDMIRQLYFSARFLPGRFGQA